MIAGKTSGMIRGKAAAEPAIAGSCNALMRRTSCPN
jgi:hypothetical protein